MVCKREIYCVPKDIKILSGLNLSPFILHFIALTPLDMV
jgi:hypothetical protein